MNEQMLVELMEDIDISLLEDIFVEEDVSCNRGFILTRYYQDKTKAGFSEKFEIKVEAVKSKVNYLVGIVSGIVATIVLVASVAAIVIKKKSSKLAWR